MELSTTELFLAYRQAKASLHQEQQGAWKIAWARSERNLPQILARLRRHLAGSPGWFAGLNVGQVWLLPKKAIARRSRSGITHIGGDYRAPLESIAVRPHLTPSVDFATVEVIWLWQFGAALEALLGPNARGNRLKLINSRREFNKDALGCFEFWPVAYREFREQGFAVARQLLNKGRRRCLVATFDLASYYDEVDPAFLVSDALVGQVERTARAHAISFDRAEYVTATKTLLDAYARYRLLCRQLTGLSTTKGIPIGCLSSKLVSNIALASLDEHIRQHPTLRYYARYVDDMLIVADASSRTPTSATAVARTFLPTNLKPAGGRSRELTLDVTKLERAGSRFRLQTSKLRGYVLTGRRGRDFLDTVERDVRLIASERRAFLLPDGLGSDSPLTALFVGSDGEAPVQALREIDRLKVGRYAASVAVGKTAVGVELLNPPDAASWCRRQLAPLAGHMTSPEQWLEFLELALRALAVCVRAQDTTTARFILRRQSAHFNRLAQRRETRQPEWNGHVIPWRRARKALQLWYEHRRLEEIASALPLAEVAAKRVGPFLRSLLGRPLRVDERTVGGTAIVNRVGLLHAADLRTADRETDLQRVAGRDVFPTERRWGRLVAMLRKYPGTSDRSSEIDKFLGVCREIGDATYERVSLVDLLLMTRPPTQFDIACRWSKGRKPMGELSIVTNAVRGNRYDALTVRQPDANTIDITTLDWWLRGAPDDVQVVLGNVRTKVEWWTAAAKGTPILTRDRMAALGRIVNDAIRIRHRKKQPTVLVLPELSLPRHLLRALAHRLIQEDVSLVAGLEYGSTPSGVVNEAVGVFAPGFKVAAVWWWPKSLPARGEHQDLLKLGVTFVQHQGTPVAVSTDFGAVSTLICSELLDVRLRAELLGRIDLLVVPAWNQDTATFDHTVQTTANDLHCYTAVVNNALFSDCRVQVPSDERYLRDACRLISRADDGTIAVAVSADSLRKFQLASLADPTVKLPGFKPLPPGYQFRRL
jgi:hypothetical protein